VILANSTIPAGATADDLRVVVHQSRSTVVRVSRRGGGRSNLTSRSCRACCSAFSIASKHVSRSRACCSRSLASRNCSCSSNALCDLMKSPLAVRLSALESRDFLPLPHGEFIFCDINNTYNTKKIINTVSKIVRNYPPLWWGGRPPRPLTKTTATTPVSVPPADLPPAQHYRRIAFKRVR
jgi:hypothetical protein